MSTDPNQLASTSSRDLAFKVLGGFVLVSVFDPIIFEIIHEHFKDSQVFVYRLFNILYGVLPLIILVGVWVFETRPHLPHEQKLKKLVMMASLGILMLSMALFYEWIRFSLFFPLFGLVLFVLALLRHYQKKSKLSIKKAIKVHIGLMGLMTVVLLTFGLSVSKDTFSTNLYQESFQQYDSLHTTRKELSSLKDSLLNVRYQQRMELSESKPDSNPKIDLLKRKNIEVQYHTKETIEKFCPLFEAIRGNEFFICCIVFILLLWFLSYAKFRRVSDHFYHTIKVTVWVYALLIFNLMQSVSVKHITADKEGFMYYVGNWYVPSAIKNTYVDNSTSNIYDQRPSSDVVQGDVTIALDAELSQEYVDLIKTLKLQIRNNEIQIIHGPNNIYPEKIHTGISPGILEDLICILENIASEQGVLIENVKEINTKIKEIE